MLLSVVALAAALFGGNSIVVAAPLFKDPRVSNDMLTTVTYLPSLPIGVLANNMTNSSSSKILFGRQSSTHRKLQQTSFTDGDCAAFQLTTSAALLALGYVPDSAVLGCVCTTDRIVCGFPMEVCTTQYPTCMGSDVCFRYVTDVLPNGMTSTSWTYTNNSDASLDILATRIGTTTPEAFYCNASIVLKSDASKQHDCKSCAICRDSNFEVEGYTLDCSNVDPSFITDEPDATFCVNDDDIIQAFQTTSPGPVCRGNGTAGIMPDNTTVSRDSSSLFDAVNRDLGLISGGKPNLVVGVATMILSFAATSMMLM